MSFFAPKLLFPIISTHLFLKHLAICLILYIYKYMSHLTIFSHSILIISLYTLIYSFIMSSYPDMSAALDEYDDCEADTHRMRMAVMMTLVSSSSGGHREYIDRGREEGHQHLMDDYWSPNPTYNARIFRRRFRMQPTLFDRIMNDVVGAYPFFARKKDALNKVSLSPYQKITSAIFMLANGCSVDSLDQLCRLGESTTLSCLKKFCKAIIGIYGSWYLRTPNPNDLRRLLEKATKRGFPGMIGSIDCMHWEWRNCPTAWAGQLTGHKHKPTIVLEAVASYDTWIWHAFFGTAGSNNDLNVLACSPVFDAVVNGCAPQVSYMVNNNIYNQCYYLAGEIYPTWATFVKTISNPDTPKKRLFAAKRPIAKMWKKRLAFYKRDRLSYEDPVECIKRRHYVI
ncbi:unnamed protein product [Cuscuta epithymum]|uniref:Uncharacterized protein n=1 Tax=Cuscuta epithymum TaxID=186058 RepID=A0AAV0DYZ3_9ASTE|nr:unnamed protein product [Cuscuta epithymum]